MSEFNNIILSKVEKIESDVDAVKVAITENTLDLKYHIKRTDELQNLVEEFGEIIKPLHAEHVGKEAVKKYKQELKQDLVYKLKLPGYIVAALASLGAIMAWLGSK